MQSYQSENDGIIIPPKLFGFVSHFAAKSHDGESHDGQDNTGCVKIRNQGMIEIRHFQRSFG